MYNHGCKDTTNLDEEHVHVYLEDMDASIDTNVVYVMGNGNIYHGKDNVCANKGADVTEVLNIKDDINYVEEDEDEPIYDEDYYDFCIHRMNRQDVPVLQKNLENLYVVLTTEISISYLNSNDYIEASVEDGYEVQNSNNVYNDDIQDSIFDPIYKI